MVGGSVLMELYFWKEEQVVTEFILHLNELLSLCSYRNNNEKEFTYFHHKVKNFKIER